MNHDRKHPAVFVVDDESAIQDSLKALLGILGIRVHTFFSAKAFLESYGDEWTGCLLVDYRMPDISGIELLKELHHRGSSLSAALMTGHGHIELQQQVIDAGAVGILEKPFQVEQLKDFMERHCPELFRGGKLAANG